MHGVAHPSEEGETGVALDGIGVVHGHLVEERIHGRPQGGKRRHRALEVLGLHRDAGARLGRVEGGDELSFLGKRPVGKRFLPLSLQGRGRGPLGASRVGG
jgi:hypothetical protein